MSEYIRKPEWLKIKSYLNYNTADVAKILKKYNLNTVCEEARCPNRGECFNNKTATFILMGDVCTRNCKFCNIKNGIPRELDMDEPENVAKAVDELKIKYVVITSVTRDDLEDGGAEHFAKTINAVKKYNKDTKIETLIPDFKGDIEALKKVIEAKPDVINHNIETTARLYNDVRPMAMYNRSLELLKNVKSIDSDIFTKSGIMVGLGEHEAEVIEVFKDLRAVDCDFLTVGQYLAPSKKHYPVYEYVHPDIFDTYKKIAYEFGFKYVESGPMVRSSYHAENALK